MKALKLFMFLLTFYEFILFLPKTIGTLLQKNYEEIIQPFTIIGIFAVFHIL